MTGGVESLIGHPLQAEWPDQRLGEGAATIADLTRTAARTLFGLLGAVQEGVQALSARESPGRRVTSSSGRLYVEVNGLQRPDGDAVGHAVAAALTADPQVEWAVCNAALGTAVIAPSDPPPPVETLIALVEDAERAAQRQTSGDRPPPPPGDDSYVNQAALALGSDLIALPVAVLGQLLQWTRLPVEVAAGTGFLDTNPRLRGGVEAVLGPALADKVLATGTAAVQALAQGVAGLTVDIAAGGLRLGEALAHRNAWRQREHELTSSPETAGAGVVAIERPTPPPASALQRYADQAGMVGIGMSALTLAASRNPRRAAAVAIATLPKPATIGQEAFAATLGRTLARRGVVVTDRSALRRLDRVHVVLLDSSALTTGRHVLGDLEPLDRHVDPDELAGRAHDLYRPTLNDQVVRDGDWELGPIEKLALRARTGAQARARLQREGAITVLGLARRATLLALIGVIAEDTGAADALAAAARRANLRLVVAGEEFPATARAADQRVPGGNQLVASLRDLQADGSAVLVVSRDRRALAAADVGVGVLGHDGLPAWGADLLLGDDLANAALVIEGCGVAATIGRRSIALARGGTALAAGISLISQAEGPAAPGLHAVNGATAMALCAAVWSAAELGRRPVSPPVSRIPWHAMPATRVIEATSSSPSGLSSRDVRSRARDPRLRIPTPSLARAFAEELANPLTPILLAGAALSAAIGALTDAALVAGVTAVSGMLGAVQRVATDRAVAQLLERSATVARAIRDGLDTLVVAENLVVGDVINLAAGDVVPADCRLVEVTGMEVDESSLTGESLPVVKSAEARMARAIADRTSMVYEGTTIAAGRGRAVVVATGTATEAGRSMAATRGAAPVAGVEARLAQITRTTLPIALGSAAAVVAAGLLRGRAPRDTVGAGVGLAVASVPEGLPFLVTAAQLAAARRLSRQGTLVRNPRTIEALGRVDVLCFDKTGTLTEGRIATARVSDGQVSRNLDRLGATHRRALASALRATPRPRPGQRLPHLTDRAVVAGAERAGVDRSEDAAGWRRRAVLPFEPTRGYHAVLGHTRAGNLLSVKGAPETVLPRCSTWRDEVLGEPRLRRVNAELDRLARQGYRVLAVAERRLPSGAALVEEEVRGLALLGFIALADPVRATAGVSVRRLRDAGVQVIMITGDHPRTAQAIATELEVLDGGDVVTGEHLDQLDDSVLDTRLPRVAVVARGTPAHKARVVQAFQRLGKTVAMTGDGANDAPAIRLADVGIALGRRGTPAARAAADLVVTDDRLESILSALVEGRAMWASVREALAILVGGNLGEIAFTLVGAGLTGQSPLSARQLLLVNLLTDLAPAMAVALRPPAEEAIDALLTEGPDVSLGAVLTDDIAARAAITALGATGAWFAARATGNEERARTIALAALVGTQLGQTLAVGRGSLAVLAASVGSAAALALTIQTPAVSQFFGCTPLGPFGWGIAVVAAAAATLTGAVGPRLTSFAEATNRRGAA